MLNDALQTLERARSHFRTRAPMSREAMYRETLVGPKRPRERAKLVGIGDDRDPSDALARHVDGHDAWWCAIGERDKRHTAIDDASDHVVGAELATHANEEPRHRLGAAHWTPRRRTDAATAVRPEHGVARQE